MMQFPHFSIPSKMALTIKAVALILVTVSVYHQDLTALVNEALRNKLITYTPAIPFILAYLIHRKRKILRAAVTFEKASSERRTVSFHEIVGALLCLLAFLLYWYGSYSFYPLEFHIISLPIFLAGVILLLFNVQTLKVLIFPFAFILFLMQPSIGIVYTVSRFLAPIAADVTYNILRGVGLSVELTNQYDAPALIVQGPGNSSIPFVIGTASLGIYSLIGFSMFAFFAAYTVRGKIWHKAIVLAAGFPLIYGLNIIRIIFLLLLGYQYGIEAPSEVLYLFGEWVLIFLGTFILMSLSSRILKVGIFREKLQPEKSVSHNQGLEKTQNYCLTCRSPLKYMKVRFSKRDLFKIVTLILSVALIVTVKVPVFALTEGPAQVTIFTPSGEETSTAILPEITGYSLQFVYRNKAFEEIAGRDAALIYAYNPQNGSGTPISVTIEIASSKSVLYGPEVSLITWPATQEPSSKVIQEDFGDIQLLQNPPVTGHFFAFKQGETENVQVYLYWYVNALFYSSSASEQKYVKISLIEPSSSSSEIAEVEDKLLWFGQAITSHWQQVKMWSWMALLIAQYGYVAIMIIAALLAIIFVVRAINLREEKQLNWRIFVKFSTPEEKVILQAVHQVQKEVKPTTRAIASSYQSLTNRSIETDKLVEKLRDAETAGLVRRDIINEQDEPLVVWKSQTAFPNPKPCLQNIRKLITLRSRNIGN